MNRLGHFGWENDDDGNPGLALLDLFILGPKKGVGPWQLTMFFFSDENIF